MKYLCTLFFILVSYAQIQAQEVFASRFVVRADTIQMERFVPESAKDSMYQVMLLPLSFGQVEVADQAKLNILRNARIKEVQLVYTSFPEELDLYDLNAKRIKYLHFVCEGMFGNSLTTWKLVRQTGCKSRKEANQFFHGFVVYYLPGATVESAMDEWSDLTAILSGKKAMQDSSVFTVLQRNHFGQSAVVADFTGSMTPYATQVFVWLNMNLEVDKNREFVFFNDGDTTPDYRKRIGYTGGLYYVQSWMRDTILHHAETCRRNGYGGDTPENDIEALLFAQKSNPKLKEIILIADNWAPVRDISLLSQLKIPVHVIVCGKGSDTPVNPDLIQIFYATHGSIHTMEEDLKYLEGLTEGRTFKLGGQEYVIRYGRVERMLMR